MIMFLINLLIAIFFLYWAWTRYANFDKKEHDEELENKIEDRMFSIIKNNKLSKGIQKFKKKNDTSNKTKNINKFIKGEN